MDIENDHASSGHLDTYTSNPSSSERFDARQADSRDGLEAFKDNRFQEGDRQTSRVHDSKESTNHQSVLVSHLSSADGSVRHFVSIGSRYLLTRGTSGPDAIHQAYGLVSSLMMQQAKMLAAMNCFHLLGVVVTLGLPMAVLVRSFQISNGASVAH